MGADSKDQASFISKYAVTLKPMPDEYTQQHAKIKWWDHLIHCPHRKRARPHSGGEQPDAGTS